MVLKEKIESLIRQSAEKLGFSVYEFSIYLKGANTRIIVKIDNENGISHSNCNQYSEKLSSLLDAEEVVENYSLEISSPGINRKLRNIGEYKRFSGAPVKIVFEIDGKRDHIKGRISAVSGNSVKVKSAGKEIEISLSNIINANLDY